FLHTSLSTPAIHTLSLHDALPISYTSAATSISIGPSTSKKTRNACIRPADGASSKSSHTHFNNPNATVGAANFGVITSTLKPPGQGFFGNDPGNRILWLGARLIF